MDTEVLLELAEGRHLGQAGKVEDSQGHSSDRKVSLSVLSVDVL